MDLFLYSIFKYLLADKRSVAIKAVVPTRGPEMLEPMMGMKIKPKTESAK